MIAFPPASPVIGVVGVGGSAEADGPATPCVRVTWRRAANSLKGGGRTLRQKATSPAPSSVAQGEAKRSKGKRVQQLEAKSCPAWFAEEKGETQVLLVSVCVT